MRSLLGVGYLSFTLLFACNSGSGTDLTGYLYPARPLDAVDPSSIIYVSGRDHDEFPYEAQVPTDPTLPIQFTLHGLPEGETLVFLICDSSTLCDTTSFPVALDSVQTATFGLLTKVQRDAITASAIDPMGSVQVDTVISTGTAVIIGEIDPSHTKTQTSSVSLVSREDGQPITSEHGPYFLTPGGDVVPGGFSDAEDSYIFFDVPAGLYTLQFTSQSSQSSIDVVAVPGKWVFGYNVP